MRWVVPPLLVDKPDLAAIVAFGSGLSSGRVFRGAKSSTVHKLKAQRPRVLWVIHVLIGLPWSDESLMFGLAPAGGMLGEVRKCLRLGLASAC